MPTRRCAISSLPSRTKVTLGPRGLFVFGVLEGWMIEDGKLCYPVREASLIGNGIDVLRKVDRVGNDFEFDHRGGFCGKGQMVPVGFAQPTIRIEAMTVGGTKK